MHGERPRQKVRGFHIEFSEIPSPRVAFNEGHGRRHLENAATSQEFHTWSGPSVSEVMALFRRRPLRGGSPGHCRPRSFRHHRATTDRPTGARASRRRTRRARKMPTGTDGIFLLLAAAPPSANATVMAAGRGCRGFCSRFLLENLPPPPHRSTLPTIHLRRRCSRLRAALMVRAKR